MSDEPVEAVWVDEVREGHRPCPVCGAKMHIERKEDISIEVCPDHGIWLDSGELKAIISAIRDRSNRRRRKTISRVRRSATRDGKVKGSIFGWWSLLWD